VRAGQHTITLCLPKHVARFLLKTGQVYSGGRVNKGHPASKSCTVLPSLYVCNTAPLPGATIKSQSASLSSVFFQHVKPSTFSRKPYSVMMRLLLVLTVLFTLFVSSSPTPHKRRPPPFNSRSQNNDDLYCPERAYYCCPNLSTWLVKLPCEAAKRAKSPQKCYKKKQWACCVPGVRLYYMNWPGVDCGKTLMQGES